MNKQKYLVNRLTYKLIGKYASHISILLSLTAAALCLILAVGDLSVDVWKTTIIGLLFVSAVHGYIGGKLEGARSMAKYLIIKKDGLKEANKCLEEIEEMELQRRYQSKAVDGVEFEAYINKIINRNDEK